MPHSSPQRCQVGQYSRHQELWGEGVHSGTKVLLSVSDFTLSDLPFQVSDFGGAKLLGQKRSPGGSNGPLQVQFVEVGMGTLGYVAPEVLMSGEVGTASDVFR